ncbi:MAG: stage II sporulation protein M [Thermoanaerobaculia bacterium]
MRYRRFVELRRPVWEAFAAGLRSLGSRRGLDYDEVEELAAGYRRVLHDQALARWRYPGTETAARLQALALEGTRALAPRSRPRRGGLTSFFRETFPRAFRAHLPGMGVAVALFAATALLGLTLVLVSPAFGTFIVGPEGLARLARGELWTDDLTTMAPASVNVSKIATNNLSVALTAWAGGALAGLGSLYIVLLNGFHLGSIFAVTAHYSMAGRLATFVIGHGLLEITLILVCAGSGLMMGRALVVPGETGRSEALVHAGRQALAVLGGCLPWFVVLAGVESILSPTASIALPLKVGIGLALEISFLSIALQPTSRRTT